MPAVWNSAKAKIQLRLSIQRLRTLQQKKEAQAKSARRDIATLIEKSKIETARIKAEGLINEDIYLELLELLELYCELLLARFGVLDQNIIFAAPRTELKELHVLRDMLMHKYGRDFSSAAMENRDGCVNDRVARKLEVNTPSPELVNAYMTEIAKAYGVPWTVPDSESKHAGSKEDGEGGTKLDDNEEDTQESKASDPPPTESEKSEDGGSAAAIKPPAPETPEDEFELLTKRFAALKKR
ncbi:hypothetical protein D9758_000508 [Tetrapyrgos nigripes]|uniref:DUF292-domain-containing protein n=1 Tax=Tetrapyrgos nigripes TaxID=182062 RepID=A0A8H5H214_9AGAR|nr:hypothetical protein D9758_000508 [Tetrapyrgos nigripes]